MESKALILHGYSSRNRGDGLLVEETVALLREALGGDTDITLCASDPESFRHLPVTLHSSRPSARGWRRDYLRVLRQLDRYDLVVGVGGGYLRAGRVTEALKCALVMGPQLVAAAFTSSPTVYLPQSIGPLRGGTRALYAPLLRRLSLVMVRDDRSMKELGLDVGPNNAVRMPDLAIASPDFTSRFDGAPETTGLGDADRPGGHPGSPSTVLSVRQVHGKLPPLVVSLAGRLRDAGVPVVGYVQSTVGGNDDGAAQEQVTPGNTVDEDEYLRRGVHHQDPPRVVVAVRLHAALLAVRAGHRVIHLAYERKGFSAFADLGLGEWVHNVNSFDVDQVVSQVVGLREDPEDQSRYDSRVRSSVPVLQERHREMVDDLRRLARTTSPA
ncbi:polysaccharide pyruvyl transferase family protein [Corynebacterium neomassiliense]|uniref:polysaccharide pyruvyl transferase family protein n=1 Tax=Corynebacterium neomassiliense TaxID=2079482 RepID=UPI00102FBFCB|nr:polysaccharide pyruvyl transferase family protein [Corynebacterium neomassiliense]